MASAIRQMTSVGGDIRKIARLLQKKAPPGHMLAYINQEEADLLKARGGSGKPHEDTGVPSFEEEYVPETELFSNIGLAPKQEGISFETPYLDKQEANRGFYSATSGGESEFPMPPVTADVSANNAAAPFVSLGAPYTGAQLSPAYTSGGFGLTAPSASAVQPVDAAGYAGTDRTLGTAKTVSYTHLTLPTIYSV